MCGSARITVYIESLIFFLNSENQRITMNYILRLQVPRLNGAHRAQLDVVVQNSKSYFAQPSLVDVQLHALYVFENEI